MKHLGTLPLTTERLLLRPFTLNDASAMYRNWANDPEVTRYLTWPAHESVDVTKRVLESWVSQYADGAFWQWAIVPKEAGEPVGVIGAVRQDESIGMVHIGYCLGRRWWHKGLMSEALSAILRFFFEQEGALRVESRHDPNNAHSGMVMAHCGMLREGTLRMADRNNQGLCDCTYYGLLANDYFAAKSR